MNKKVNTILFILGATLFNIIVAVVAFIAFAWLYFKFVAPIISQTGQSWSFTLLFIAAIAVSFLVYRAVLKFFISKIEVEKYFDPLFVKRKFRKN